MTNSQDQTPLNKKRIDDFNFGRELLKYRLRENLKQDQMAELLSMSQSTYSRFENDIVQPSFKKVKQYTAKLNLNPDFTPRPTRKWYQSRKLNWITPMLISAFVLRLLYSSVHVRAGYGTEKFEAHPPIKAFIVVGAVFCLFFWYYWPPEWPFKKKK